MAMVTPALASGTSSGATHASPIGIRRGCDLWLGVSALARRRRHEDWEFWRDIILFLSGLIGIFVELARGAADPGLLVIFAAMLGLPITLRGGKDD